MSSAGDDRGALAEHMPSLKQRHERGWWKGMTSILDEVSVALVCAVESMTPKRGDGNVPQADAAGNSDASGAISPAVCSANPHVRVRYNEVVPTRTSTRTGGVRYSEVAPMRTSTRTGGVKYNEVAPMRTSTRMGGGRHNEVAPMRTSTGTSRGHELSTRPRGITPRFKTAHIFTGDGNRVSEPVLDATWI